MSSSEGEIEKPEVEDERLAPDESADGDETVDLDAPEADDLAEIADDTADTEDTNPGVTVDDETNDSKTKDSETKDLKTSDRESSDDETNDSETKSSQTKAPEASAEDKSDVEATETPATRAATTQTLGNIPPRRAFIYGAVGSGASLALGAAAGFDISNNNDTETGRAVNVNETAPANSITPEQGTRSGVAYRIRESAAASAFQANKTNAEQRRNDDLERYADERYYANFTKTLPSNDFGEVEPEAFEALSEALKTGETSDFNAIPLDNAATRGLANPQAAFKYVLSGSDSHTTRIEPSHTLRSPQLAAEMAEVYWQALLRDLPFAEYGESELATAAANDLNRMSFTPGVGSDGSLNPEALFRGETPGDLRGPYISQFLLKPFSHGPVDIEQRYAAPTTSLDYMTDRDSWLAVQRGARPARPISFEADKKYIYNNRLLGEYVHRDVTCQAYVHAALILIEQGPQITDPANPYRDTANQGGFVSFGPAFILDLVMRAANLALTGAWFQKWRAHLTLRPEALAGRIHFTLTGDRSYELDSEILNSDAVARVQQQNGGTAFLPQAYAEGSPVHPSYPAGHATIAGACVTVLKALFDEDAQIVEPVTTNSTGDALLPYIGELTVGGELNKLGANVSIGRDAAGVHYRQDGIQGLAAGEQQAIALLQDESRTTTETDFDGFSFVKFDGSRITIRNGSVEQS